MGSRQGIVISRLFIWRNESALPINQPHVAAFLSFPPLQVIECLLLCKHPAAAIDLAHRVGFADWGWEAELVRYRDLHGDMVSTFYLHCIAS